MPGIVWRGQNKGVYFVGIDFDKLLGFHEFCNIFGANTSIEELKYQFIVEQHEGDPNSFHLYFFLEILENYFKKLTYQIIHFSV